jgi:hypothetical protein
MGLHFIRAELPDGGSGQLATVYYSLGGADQPLGLRFDLGKRVFLDLTGSPEIDARLGEAASAVADAISGYRRTQSRVFSSLVNLSKKHAFDGYFWLPGKPLDSTAGTLVYSPKGKIRLRLPTGFPPGTSFAGLFASNNFPVIHARLTSGQTAVLIDCFITNRQFTSFGPGTTEILVNRCILGADAEDFETADFVGFSARFTSLEEWMTAEPLAKVVPGSPIFGETTVTIKPPASLSFDLSDENVQVTIASAYLSHSTATLSSYRVGATLRVRGTKRRQISELLGISGVFQDLFSLFFGEATILEEQTLAMRTATTLQNGETVDCPFLAARNAGRIQRHIAMQEMLLPLGELPRPFADLARAWFGVFKKHRSAVSTFFGMMFFPRVPLDLRLISVLSTLETYHRSTMDTRDQDLALNARLIALAGGLPESTRIAVLSDAARLFERATVTRDYYLHGLHDADPRLLDGSPLYVAEEKLRVMFIALLLLELGIPEERLVAILSRKPWIRWAMQQHLE